MKIIDRITFLIHGFCWTCRDWGPSAEDRFRPYLTREQLCVKGWRSRLKAFSESEALVVIPGGQGGEAGEFYADAASALGDRLFMLDCADCLQPHFWADGNSEYYMNLVREVKAAFVHQQFEWNQEELHTALHCRACCTQFEELLTQRRYYTDPLTVSAEAWGASFDGCVMKYTLNLRRMLGWAGVIDINYPLTVPDAPFLLDTQACECVMLADGLRLFLLEKDRQIVGLYTFTAHSLSDQPAYVKLPGAPKTLTVKSKQGLRLWPEPEPYVFLVPPPLGCFEPSQMVARADDEGLQVPVSAGYVYRLAKAPAYVFFPPEMAYPEAKAILASARLVT